MTNESSDAIKKRRGGKIGNRSRLRHGHAIGGKSSPTHTSWTKMMDRCHRSTDAQFHLYGGRGIHVCARWHDFSNFLADMGLRPGGTTIDRINNDGIYEMGNCRWATSKEQSRNTSRTRFIEFNGERLCISDWERKLGFGKGVLAWRTRNGWSMERALAVRTGEPT